jgi:hypothetical protein
MTVILFLYGDYYFHMLFFIVPSFSIMDGESAIAFLCCVVNSVVGKSFFVFLITELLYFHYFKRN